MRAFLLLPVIAFACVAEAAPNLQIAAKAMSSEAAGPIHKGTGPRVASFVVERRADGVVGSAAAMMRARLAVVGNCVLVKAENGDEIVPVFSAGTASWNPRPRQLRYLDQLYSVGDIVPIGGGGLNPAMIPSILRNPLVDIPSDCPTSRLWFTGG